MAKEHIYKTKLNWAGGSIQGPARNYKNYSREYEINIEGKPILRGSSDPAFMGDANLHNPEDLLLASISSCHMLWYLHLCTVNGIVVVDYQDGATGVMVEEKNGAGYFSAVTLHPVVTIEVGGDEEKALSLHHKANKMCFIANSLNFKVDHAAQIISSQ